MDPLSEITLLLKVSGAVEVRSKKHRVFKLSDGRSFTIPKTPRSERSYDNSLAQLKRMLDIKPEKKDSGKREKPRKPGRFTEEDHRKDLKKRHAESLRNKHKLPPYRDGKVHVLSRKCDTCIYRPGGFDLAPGRLKQLSQEAVAADSCIVCHETLDGAQAVCRGFYDAHKTQPLQLAERLGALVEVEPPLNKKEG